MDGTTALSDQRFDEGRVMTNKTTDKLPLWILRPSRLRYQAGGWSLAHVLLRAMPKLLNKPYENRCMVAVCSVRFKTDWESMTHTRRQEVGGILLQRLREAEHAMDTINPQCPYAFTAHADEASPNSIDLNIEMITTKKNFSRIKTQWRRHQRRWGNLFFD